jgi:O-antigen/teichoic acid export membrane protein
MLKRLTGSVWATLEYVWQPMLLLLATPWFLRQLGVEQYGLWMLLAATVGLSGILVGGTGPATIKAVSAGRDSQVSNSAIKASLMIALVGGAVLAVVVAALFWFGGEVIFAKMGKTSMVGVTGVIAAILLWIEQVDNVFSSALKGSMQFGYAASLEISSKTTQIGLIAFVLLLNPTLYAVYATLVVTSIFRLLLKALVTKRLLKLASISPTFDGVAELLHFAKWGWLLGIGGVLFSAGDRMLIGSVLGASSLAYYAIAAQLAMQVHAISAAGCSVIFPLASRHYERADFGQLRKIATMAFVANIAVSSLLVLALYLLAPIVLELWVGSATATHVIQVMPLLLAAYWMLALNVVPYYVLLGVGRIKFVGISAIFSGMAGMASLYLFLPTRGFIASPSGRLVYAIISLVLLFPFIQVTSRKREGMQ